MLMYLLPLVAPALLLAAGLAGFIGGGRRPTLAATGVAEIAALAAIIASLATAALLLLRGSGTGFLGIATRQSLSTRVDAVSVTMQLLVSYIGWIVVRYSANYLDGEPRQGPFAAWLCLTLTAVLTLVTAGNLPQFVAAWIATSIFLHRLLLFYPERVAAQRAARKKFISARIGDAALVGASVLLYANYGTTDIAQILSAARGSAGNGLTWAAALLLALAALLKSAQFPAHGWLTEVMETPTPVSALLHAGVINAGGFLDPLRGRAGAVAERARAPGDGRGIHRAFRGLVMLTQPAVKTSLAWSTVGQIGIHGARVWPWAVSAGAAAHHRAFALQG